MRLLFGIVRLVALVFMVVASSLVDQAVVQVGKSSGQLCFRLFSNCYSILSVYA
jgi:phage-related holin